MGTFHGTRIRLADPSPLDLRRIVPATARAGLRGKGQRFIVSESQGKAVGGDGLFSL